MSKVCVITGSSGCIGSSIAEKFYKAGHTLALVDVDARRIDDVIKEKGLDKDKVSIYSCDVSNEDQVSACVRNIIDKFDRIDVLVNAAGICGKYNKCADTSYDEFKKIYSVNVFGTFLMMKYSLPYMVKQRSGSIVNFGSVSGMRGYTYETAYGSSKWAVIGMTKNVASEYGKYNIRVNSVSPGWVDSPMMQKTVDNYHELGTNHINLGVFDRAAKPMEIADAVYFLASNEAKYITGTNLTVEGGMLL